MKANKYRKRPVIIEAIQFTGKNGADIIRWAWEASAGSAPICLGNTLDGPCLIINTLEGFLTAKPLNWIICGVRGEFYPCDDAIFKETYEKIENE